MKKKKFFIYTTICVYAIDFNAPSMLGPISINDIPLP